MSFRDFGANNMAHESGHESDENFEQSLEDRGVGTGGHGGHVTPQIFSKD